MAIQHVANLGRSICYFICAVFFLTGAILTLQNPKNPSIAPIYIVSASAFVIGSIIDLVSDTRKLWRPPN